MKKLLFVIMIFVFSFNAAYAAEEVYTDSLKEAKSLGNYEKVKICNKTYYKGKTTHSKAINSKKLKLRGNIKLCGYTSDKYNTPFYQPNLYNNGIQPLFSKGIKGKGINIAVLDADVSSLSDLNIDWTYAYDAINNKPLLADGNAKEDHGTSVCGIISAKEKNGLLGVAPQAQIIPIRIGTEVSVREENIYRALCYLDELLDEGKVKNLKVVNMSFAFIDDKGYNIQSIDYYTDNFVVFKEIADKIHHIHDVHKVTFVAASGNDGNEYHTVNGKKDYLGDNLSFPSGLEDVVSVGMCDWSNTLSMDSVFNSQTDLIAVGDMISVYTRKGGVETYGMGTSFSAPVVSGIFALMYSQNPNLNENEILSALKSTGTKLRKDRMNPRKSSDYKGKKVVNATFAYNKLFNQNLKVDVKYAFDKPELWNNETSVRYNKKTMLDDYWFSGLSVYGLSLSDIPKSTLKTSVGKDKVTYKLTVKGNNYVTRSKTFKIKKYPNPSVKFTKSNGKTKITYKKNKYDSLRLKINGKYKYINNKKTSGTYTCKGKVTVQNCFRCECAPKKYKKYLGKWKKVS